MGFNLNLKGGLDESLARLQSPFDRYKNRETIKSNLRAAQNRNDFPSGFEILEYSEGRPLLNEKVTLLADAMPIQPFSFGGQQKIIKDYYAGNSEPSIQVLGPRENDITIKGRLKAKRFKDTSSRFAANAEDTVGDSFREYPTEMQQLIEAMRIRGNLVRITMGEFQRWGFIEECNFNLKTVADIEYEIKFSIIGFNPPSNYLIVGKTRTIPFDINKNLLSEALTFQQTYSVVPESMPQSLAEQFNEAIGEVAAAVSLVTGFVDGVLNEVDSLKASLSRAKGLILNAKTSLAVFKRRVGAFNPTGSVSTTGGISGAYTNASFIKNSISASFGIMAILASLQAALAKIAETEPLGRHRVASGDTLQKIAIKFYNDASQWKEIYDHNKLQSTELTVGAVLEIPRIT